MVEEHNITVVVSGEKDFITDADKEKNSTIWLSSYAVSYWYGMCINSCYSLLLDNSFEAAHFATSYFGLCGNLAEKRANRPASFIDLYEAILC
ncbi:MAG: hypothetical protein MRQ07_04410 [Candidatus Midichloria sp.]|nr:hypothetical protein [Candidatus Midichloria sp.]